MALIELLGKIFTIFMVGVLTPESTSTPTTSLNQDEPSFTNNDSAKKRSWVWKFFDLSDCKKIVRCTLCKNRLAFCGSTTTMSSHLSSGMFYFVRFILK
jgi:hypothetical protein